MLALVSSCCEVKEEVMGALQDVLSGTDFVERKCSWSTLCRDSAEGVGSFLDRNTTKSVLAKLAVTNPICSA